MKYLILLFCLSTSCFAFDGNRPGLQFSFGAGAGKLDAEFSENKKLNETTLTYAVKIGYGFGNRFSVFLEKESRIYEYLGEDILNEITGVGAKLYLTPRFFIFGAGGIGGFMNDISIDISKAAIGTGYFYGLGFEIFKNMSLELTQSKLSIDQSELDKDNIVSPIEQTSTNLMLMINFF